MQDTKFDPKDVMEISKETKNGALMNAKDYDGFVALIEKSDNVADTIGEVEKEIAQKLQVGKEIKAVVESFAKPLKSAEAQIRQHLTQYMVENDFDRFDGEVTKSITLQKAKTTDGILSIKQIKIRGKYIDLDTFKYDDLVRVLEDLGVKTRVRTEEATATKDASIRIQK